MKNNILKALTAILVLAPTSSFAANFDEACSSAKSLHSQWVQIATAQLKDFNEQDPLKRALKESMLRHKSNIEKCDLLSATIEEKISTLGAIAGSATAFLPELFITANGNENFLREVMQKRDTVNLVYLETLNSSFPKR